MSKRVSNNRPDQSRKITGRQRVRLGWRKRMWRDAAYEARRVMLLNDIGVKV